MSEYVDIDLRDPKPGTLGYRIRRVEEDHEPDLGTLGDRLCFASSVGYRLRRGVRKARATA